MVRGCGAGKRPIAIRQPADANCRRAFCGGLAKPEHRKGVVQMRSLLSTLKIIIRSASMLKAMCTAFALLFVLAHPAAAQLSFKPTAESVHEDQLLNALKEGDKITGRISIPEVNAANLIQPAGRDWRDFQRSKLPIIGGVIIIGMFAALLIFLMVRG